MKAARIPEWEEEYRFHPVRRWRFDFAWPFHMVAVEVDGGTWNGGRHVTGDGFSKDCEKLNEAQLLGWKTYRVTTDMIRSGAAIEFLGRALKSC